MTDQYRRFAAIVFDGSSNLQLNYEGFQQKVLADFEKACTGRKAVWARLLDWRTGDVAATYSAEQGLQLTEPGPISGAPLADVLEGFWSDEYQAKIGQALIAGIREIDFTLAQYAHLTKYLNELGPAFLAKQDKTAASAGPGGMS